MIIAANVKKYLAKYRVPYQVISHQRTQCLEDAVAQLEMNTENLVEAQLVADDQGVILVVVPYQRRINFEKLKHKLNRNLRLMPAFKSNRLFYDCEPGSRPPFGDPYGLDMIMDKSIGHLDSVLIESGCHTALLKISVNDFLFLNARAIHSNIIGQKRISVKHANNLIQDPIGNITVEQSTRFYRAFPQLPVLAKQILALSDRSGGNKDVLINTLAHDETILNQILSYANLPYFNKSKNKKTDIEQVVESILGFDTVSHVALGIAASRAFQQLNKEINLIAFWRHAFCCALLSKLIAEKVVNLEQLEPQMCFLAGFMHNFGYLLFAQLFPPEFRLLNKWLRHNPKASIPLLEQRLLGMGNAQSMLRGGHAGLGAGLMRHWQMPEILVTVAKAHHTQNYQGRYAGYVQVIQLANQLLRQHGIGDGNYGGPSTTLISAVGISLELLDICLQEVLAGIQGIENLAVPLTKQEDVI